MSAFTVDHEGHTFTLDPNDWPAEYEWLPLGDDVHSVCVEHRCVFDARRGPGCEECDRAFNRNPTQAEIGLVELPDWWTSSRRGSPPTPCLFCEEHRVYFDLTEACRRCVDLDDAMSGRDTDVMVVR